MFEELGLLLHDMHHLTLCGQRMSRAFGRGLPTRTSMRVRAHVAGDFTRDHMSPGHYHPYQGGPMLAFGVHHASKTMN